MLRCKVWRTNLFTVVNLFTTPIFYCIMTTLNKPLKFEFERGGGLEKSPNLALNLYKVKFILIHLWNPPSQHFSAPIKMISRIHVNFTRLSMKSIWVTSMPATFGFVCTMIVIIWKPYQLNLPGFLNSGMFDLNLYCNCSRNLVPFCKDSEKCLYRKCFYWGCFQYCTHNLVTFFADCACFAIRFDFTCSWIGSFLHPKLQKACATLKRVWFSTSEHFVWTVFKRFTNSIVIVLESLFDNFRIASFSILKTCQWCEESIVSICLRICTCFSNQSIGLCLKRWGVPS